MQKIYTPKEVAEILKVDYRYVLQLIKENKIKAINLGKKNFRITEKSLEEFINN